VVRFDGGPISPIAAPSEEQKEDEDNKNEIHFFSKISGGKFPSSICGAK
jgi:hypothetical protein